MAMTNTEGYRQEEAASLHARIEEIAERYGCIIYNEIPDYIGQWPELKIMVNDDHYEFPYEELGFERELIRQQLETTVGRIVEQCPREHAAFIGLMLGDYVNKLILKAVDDADV